MLSKKEIYYKIANKQMTVNEALVSLEKIYNQYAMPKQNLQKQKYPLSEGQKALWIFEQLAPNSYAYNTPVAFRVIPKLDIKALRRACQRLQDRHPVLNSVFCMADEEPVQAILEKQEICFIQKDISDISDFDIENRIREEARKSFDLESGPLMRVTLFKKFEGDYILLINFHHIIIDGVSAQIFIEELCQCYHAEISGERLELPRLKSTYAEFVYWQKKMLDSEEGRKHRNFWHEKLSGNIPVLELPTDKRRPIVPTYKGETYSVDISKSITQELSILSKSENTTLFSLMLTAYIVLLYRYTYQEDILVGTPVVGRPETRFENVIGYFMNMVVIRSDLSGNPTFQTLLNQVHETTLNAIEHSDYPFLKLTEDLRKIKGNNISNLFQAAFYFQNWLETSNKGKTTSKIKNSNTDPLFLSPIESIHQEGEFDLTLELFEYQNKCKLNLKYNPDIFEETTIRRMATHYIQILKDVIKFPHKKLAEISLLTQEEEHRLLFEWNDTNADYPRNKCMHELFEEQARMKPESIAVIYEDKNLTYRQLDTMATQLAMYLMQNGVKTGTLVGMIMERSIEMMIGLLGILKAGGAYVPLDPTYPAERLLYMLEDTNLPILITQSSVEKKIPECKAKVIRLDTDWERIVEESRVGYKKRKAVNAVDTENLAYVIYTSGSTGKPKGVQVLHRGLTNFLWSMAQLPGCTDKDHLLAITTLSFDIAALELYLPLIKGGRIEIVPSHITKDGVKLKEMIEGSNATIIQATPATWQMLIAAEWKDNKATKILCGGEALNKQLSVNLLTRSTEVWNMFGPTETTIWSSVSKVEAERRITIGRPINNTKFYILDKHLNPVPVGVTGELYIGGDGLAKGYLNRPELTREKFTIDPFSKNKGSRLYRTGDSVRYLPDGSIEFIDRVDRQVKIRGFRIELEEVESALRKLEGIQETIAVVREDSPDHKRLVAFVLLKYAATIKITKQLQEALRKWLPEYMIPSEIIHLKSFPLTMNRKLDKKLLSSMELSEIKVKYGNNESEYKKLGHKGELKSSALTGNETFYERDDHLLQYIKKDILEIAVSIVNAKKQDIEADTNMGEYGFDSIRFVTLSVKLNKKYEIKLDPTSFYEYSTIESLSSHLLTDYREIMEKHYKESMIIFEQKVSPNRIGKGRLRIQNKGGKISASKVTSMNEPIAIIGIGCKMPHSPDHESFWKNLVSEKDLITEVPADRWDWRMYHEELSQKENKPTTIWSGGFIEDVDKFDASFFGISPREAELMDPQQRLFLETIWKTIEDAGYKPSDFSGSKTGVFAGVTSADYKSVVENHYVDVDAHTLTGIATMIIPSRVSYLLNLNGPSELIDTACSSSLVALHRAINALHIGDCKMAIVGGVNLMLSPIGHIVLTKNGMLSKDGRCKTFDRTANGYVRGEGVGVVLLKPLIKAETDGDHIYAVIKGSAENHGGRTNSLTAPNPNSQAKLLIEAYERARIDPGTMTYIEVHGTGTELGDPIEVNGLKKAFENLYKKWNKTTPVKEHCGLGSVKTNIGHLEAAAGIAGVLKVVLGMKYRKIPASLHCNKINPYVELEGSPFYIVQKTKEWECLRNETGAIIPRRAGVSSFGMGGSNVHLVLEEYKDKASPSNLQEEGPHLIVLSAKNEKRLKAYAKKMVEYLEKASTLNLEEGAYDEDLIDKIKKDLANTVSEIFKVTHEDIDTKEIFSEYGFDQVSLTKLTEMINKKYNLEITPAIFSEYQSIESLAYYLSKFKINSQLEIQNTKTAISLSNLAYTLQVGREAMEERLAIVVSSVDELKDKLDQYSRRNTDIENLYRGNIKTNNANTKLIFDEKEGEEFIRSIINNKKHTKLAQFWVLGVEIDWQLLYPSHTPKRISLPTYPFARKRYWITEVCKAKYGKKKGFHPLVDNVANRLSLNQGLVFQKIFQKSDLIVNDHKVGGQFILPSAGYLEMAYAAVSQIGDGFDLKQVFWLKPLVFEDDKKGIQIVIKEDDGQIGFEIQSINSTQTITHAKGKFYQNGESGKKMDQRISIEKFKERCPRRIDKETIYTECANKGIDYGAYFQVVNQIWYNDDEALGYLNLPPAYGNDLGQYTLHPTLMEGVFQTIAGLAAVASNGNGIHPLILSYIEEVEVLHPLASQGYACVKTSGEQLFNAAILDENGLVCIKLKGISLKPAHTELASIINEELTEKKNVFFIYPKESQGLKRILADAHQGDEVVDIILGTETKQHAEKVYEIKTDARLALDSCIRQFENVNNIYFLGGMQSQEIDTDDLEVLEQSQEQGPLSLIRLMKSLSQHGHTKQPVKLKVITNDYYQFTEERGIKLYSSNLNALTKYIAREYPKMETSCIDINLKRATAKISEKEIHAIVGQILSEPLHSSGDDVVVCDGRKYTVPIDSVLYPTMGKISFKHHGVYIVLYYAEHIEPELGCYLAENVQAKLILIGRSELNDEIQNKITQIESKGGKVLYIQADVANLESMNGAIQKAKSQFNKIDGVIYVADVLQDNTIEKINENTLRASLIQVAKGSVILNKVMQGDDLNFIISLPYKSSELLKQNLIVEESVGNMMINSTNKDNEVIVNGKSIQEISDNSNYVKPISYDHNNKGIPGNGVSIETLRKKTSDYLKSVLAVYLKTKSTEIDSQTDIINYGVNSMIILEINRQFENDFGKLPTTLITDSKTVEGLTEYLMRYHRERLEKKVCENKSHIVSNIDSIFIDNSGDKKITPLLEERLKNKSITKKALEPEMQSEGVYCKKCILKKDHPGISVDVNGICNLCNFEIPREIFANYSYIEENYKDFIESLPKKDGGYDCLLMLSGGKDSIHMLDKLVSENTRKILSFTYYHPYEAKAAMNNIERVLELMNVDHITFANHTKYRKLMGYVFNNVIGEKPGKYLDEKIPCVVCSHYMVISACLLSYKMKIPYVLYCADPIQMVTLGSNLKRVIKTFIDRIGKELVNDIFGNQLDMMLQNGQNELPKIVYPYISMRDTYNPKEIILGLEQKGLYDSKRIETHCSLYALLNYYSYKHWDCNYYAQDISVNVRAENYPKESRKSTLKEFEELKRIIFEIASDKGNTEKQKEQLIELFSRSLSDSEAKYLSDNILSLRKIAGDLGVKLD